MQYKIRKLDGRYTHREYFAYTIVFSPRMSPDNKGMLWFNDVKRWFERTYGSSSEIREWREMLRYHHAFGSYLDNAGLPEHVNFNWSYTNGYDDLLIYVKSNKELTMFKLAHSVDGATE
jgi:hypothetical protein